MVYKIKIDKIMRQINAIELVALNGGTAAHDCMSLLQFEAHRHLRSQDQQMEDAYWDNWMERYDACVGSH